VFGNSPYAAATSAASSSEYSATAAGLSVVFAGMAILAIISGAAFSCLRRRWFSCWARETYRIELSRRCGSRPVDLHGKRPGGSPYCVRVTLPIRMSCDCHLFWPKLWSPKLPIPLQEPRHPSVPRFFWPRLRLWARRILSRSVRRTSRLQQLAHTPR
jgi:hypothetical protein